MDYVIFPNNLREIRKSKKISQETLAHATGISRTTIVNIEAGTQEPSIMKAYYIAAYMKEPLLKIFPCSENLEL